MEQARERLFPPSLAETHRTSKFLGFILNAVMSASVASSLITEDLYHYNAVPSFDIHPIISLSRLPLESSRIAVRDVYRTIEVSVFSQVRCHR